MLAATAGCWDGALLCGCRIVLPGVHAESWTSQCSPCLQPSLVYDFKYAWSGNAWPCGRLIAVSSSMFQKVCARTVWRHLLAWPPRYVMRPRGRSTHALPLKSVVCGIHGLSLCHFVVLRCRSAIRPLRTLAPSVPSPGVARHGFTL